MSSPQHQSNAEPASRLLPVYEQFHTWQGEGVHLGRAAYFIRTYGCPVHCPWCDSAGTWHADFVPETVSRLGVESLVAAVREAGPEFVVITGGEPAILDLWALTRALRAAGFPVHLETSGAFPLRGYFDWITVSPKWQRIPLRENLLRADELKLIVENPTSIEKWCAFLANDLRSASVWLHPEWSRRNDPAILRSISDAVKTRGAPFRAGYQLHKLYRVDELDANSQAPVPLGGQPRLGY